MRSANVSVIQTACFFSQPPLREKGDLTRKLALFKHTSPSCVDLEFSPNLDW